MPKVVINPAAECVRVVVRSRPLDKVEMAAGHRSIVRVDERQGTIDILNPKLPDEPPKSFAYDAVYGENSKQKDMYEETFLSLVNSVLDGYNGTIFAYGQTGTGKTYTMQGQPTEEGEGVIPRSFQHIFDHINRSPANQQYLVRASYLEIYQEEIRDLLQKDQTNRLELKESPDIGIYVKDLSSFVTKNTKEIQHVMSEGGKNRSTAPTLMNLDSSRYT